MSRPKTTTIDRPKTASIEWPVVKLMLGYWNTLNAFPDRTGMSVHAYGHSYDATVSGDEFVVEIRRNTARSSRAMDLALKLGKQVAQQSRIVASLKAQAKHPDLRGKGPLWAKYREAKADLAKLEEQWEQAKQDSEQPVETVRYPIAMIRSGELTL